jgi:hypothetical protein
MGDIIEDIIDDILDDILLSLCTVRRRAGASKKVEQGRRKLLTWRTGLICMWCIAGLLTGQSRACLPHRTEPAAVWQE